MESKVLDGSVVLISGASSGIGSAAARRLAAAGSTHWSTRPA
jgi:NAD(P)-dependent dehydrogenase (short-subunit alcohol dehydrogenase family)